MATAAKVGPQDMPPPGGYNPVSWQRIRLRTVFGSKLTIGLYVFFTTVGFTGYHFNWLKVEREKTEMRSARFALMPLLMAERDRAFLKQCRINRDEERELMKDVPEWEVGTYFREPVYITREGKYNDVHYNEFFAHADYYDATYRTVRRHFS